MPGYVFHDRLTDSFPGEGPFVWNHYYYGGEFSTGLGGGSWFFQSWSQKLPPENPPLPGTWGEFANWMDIAAEASGTYEVARCPSQKLWSSTGDSREAYQWSYAMNYYLGPASGKFNTYEDAKRPSENVYIKDRDYRSLKVETYHYDYSSLPEDWQYGGLRHQGKCNFLLADGHAQPVDIEDDIFTNNDRWTQYRRTCQIFGWDW